MKNWDLRLQKSWYLKQHNYRYLVQDHEPILRLRVCFNLTMVTQVAILKHCKYFNLTIVKQICQIFPTKEQKCERTLLERKQRLVLILLNEAASASLNKKNKNGLKSRGIALPNPSWWRLPSTSLFLPLSLLEVLLLLLQPKLDFVEKYQKDLNEIRLVILIYFVTAFTICIQNCLIAAGMPFLYGVKAVVSRPAIS